eukprot:Protomagalhaensia_sp_Gyna_25__5204@NODE_626_length_2970_cov_40_978164_g485_i0_p3_GENE_NODE_626_length_2970_cov_40_978164_g485_i0NODE_626_length_2970_cov_40_978164_g485_i0_p3_ORF_typecomplete_len211_score17_99DUF962/PF06127_11/8_6e19HEV_ORF1/PF02444_16/0_33_NODE_626_length_2970_cov_40_978164_g485_i08291461
MKLSKILVDLKIPQRFNQADTEFLGLYAPYSCYHTHPVNKLIHMISIPIVYIAVLIIIDAIVLWVLALFNLESLHTMCLNSALFPPVHYMALLAKGAEPVSAMVSGITFIYLSLVSRTLFPLLGITGSLTVGLIVGLIAWTSQYYGHYTYDQSQPVSFNNPKGAILIAPYFVVMEILITLGYRPDLAAAVNEIGYELRISLDLPIVVELL